MTVHRVSTLPFTKAKIGRLASYLSFYPAAIARACTLPHFDLVITLTTPPLLSIVGSVTKRLRGSEHWIYEQDVYPDVASSLGVIKPRGFLDRLIGNVADRSRNYADGIITLGACMKDRLVRRGVSQDKVHIAENWADARSIWPLDRPGDAEDLVLLYSGNLGLAHDLQTLLSGIAALRDQSRMRFLFVGAGGRRQELNDFIQRHAINSVEQRGYVPRDQLNEGLSVGDIGVVLQQENCSGVLVPSKVYGIMASGRPVLFIGPADATPARTIAEHQCGWHIDNGDVDSLIRLLTRLQHNRDEVHAAGKRARQAFLQRYDLPLAVQRFHDLVTNAGPVPQRAESSQRTRSVHRTSSVNVIQTGSDLA